MDLHQLECFVRVVETGSFTKAAITLDLSQSVVSRHVRQLELTLKQHLLERNGRGVTPTDAGARLLAHGQGILHQMRLARQDLEAQRGAPGGRVVLGMPPSAGKLLTVGLVQAFRERYPGASLGVVEGLSVAMHEWLLLGRLDAALLYNPPPSPRIRFDPIWTEPLYLIGIDQPGRPMPPRIALADLPRYPLLLPGGANTFRNLLDIACARQGIKPHIEVEVDAIESVLDLVALGLGYALLPHNAIVGRSARPGVKATAIEKPTLEIQLTVATSTQRPLTRLAEATIELLKARILAGALRAPQDEPQDESQGGPQAGPQDAPRDTPPGAPRAQAKP